MKKLILVTLTAFAASWFLSARREDSRTPRPVPSETSVKVLRWSPSLADLQDTPDESGSIRTIPWKKGDGPRSNPKPKSKPKSKAKSDNGEWPPAEVASQKPAPLPKTPPPSWFPKTELEEEDKAKPDSFGFRVIVGRVSASEDRAKQDLRQAVERAVSEWLAADVPTSWKVPADVLKNMVESSYTQEVARNLITPEAGASPETPALDGLFTLYRAGQKLDFSPTRKARIVAMYHQELATQRMQKLGGGLALALVTLAVLSGYIKVDEATKGYYTTALRVGAAAGMGVAGTVIYRLLA